ncbi:MAG: hypothetical protein E6Q24_04870 [Chitinophagaceae bacterium]|nr:MAG: hypothetical protein E6Q24_04870 [Chitinophagaceae bacterium]
MSLLDDNISPGSNRVAGAIYFYAEQEAQQLASNMGLTRFDPRNIALKLDYYRQVRQKYRKTRPLTRDEKKSLRYTRKEIRHLKTQLRPTTWKRFWHHRITSTVRHYLAGNLRLYKEHDEKIEQIQKDYFQEHNLRELTESMKKKGFKFEVEGPLKKLIDQDLPRFHLRYADVQHRNADFILHFNKVPRSSIYYFEKFEASARPNLDTVLKNQSSRTWTKFSTNGDINFSAREAHSLVTGKSICKNINGRETWLTLDNTGFSQHDSFKQVNFDLQKVMRKLPIKGLDNPKQYQAIEKALKLGLNTEVTLLLNKEEIKCNLLAAPNRKTIDVLDSNNQLIDLGTLPGGHLNEITRAIVQKINRADDVIELYPSSKNTPRRR